MLRRLLGLPLWQPLRRRAFRMLWLGVSVSVLADQFFLVALTWLVVQISGSGLQLGSVLAVASVPGALFMLVGGWATDRFPPAVLMVVCSVARAVLTGVLAALVLSDVTRIWHLYLLAGALSVVDGFYYPASLSIVPTLVEKRQLEPANALTQGAEQVSGFVGPALAASALAFLGLGVAFGANALMFAAAALPLGYVVAHTRRFGAVKADDEGTGGETGGILAGFRYALSEPVLRAMMLILAAISVSMLGPMIVGGATLAETRFGGAGAFGTILSAFGGGSLAGVLAAGSLSRPARRGAKLLLITFALGLGISALGFAPTLWAAAAVTAGLGVGTGYLGVMLIAWLQDRAVPEFRGRLMSLVMFAIVALDPLSYALAGALTEVSLSMVFLAAGALMVVAATAGALSRAVRTLD